VIATKEFLEVCDYGNLLQSAKIARKNKLHTGFREFFCNIEENIIDLQNKLLWRLYFPQMPLPSFGDIVVEIALFRRLQHNPDIIRDMYVFALLENLTFSRAIQLSLHPGVTKLFQFFGLAKVRRVPPGRRGHGARGRLKS
jgi:hypothetical protein